MDHRRKYGATHASYGSLCDLCVHGHVVKGHAESERLTICGTVYPRLAVPFAVKECSMYLDRRLPDVEYLEEIALDLTREKLRRAGFDTPEKAPQKGFARETEPSIEVAEPVLTEDG